MECGLVLGFWTWHSYVPSFRRVDPAGTAARRPRLSTSDTITVSNQRFPRLPRATGTGTGAKYRCGSSCMQGRNYAAFRQAACPT